MATESKKKRRRRSTFATALAQAKARLQKAQQEQAAAQKLLSALSVEVPLLRHTVEALEQQVNPQPIFTPKPIPGVINEVMASLPNGDPITLSEDDLLPEPDGTELIP